jgi:hypothetical protein
LLPGGWDVNIGLERKVAGMTVSPMTISAVALTAAGMAAGLGRHNRSALRTPGALGMGAIMLGVLLVPGFSHAAATASGAVLLLGVLAGVAGARAKTGPAWASRQRTAAAVTVVDIGFMALALLLMPMPGSTLLPPLDHAGGTHPAMAEGVMIWFVLLAWTACAAVLILPGARLRRTESFFHLACSGSMIAAMAAMAV